MRRAVGLPLSLPVNRSQRAAQRLQQITTPLHATKLAEAEVQRQAQHLEWYQAFNTALHYHVISSLDLSGESELRDQRALQSHVSCGKANGVDTVLWARKFASVAGIDKQAVLLDKFRSLKLSPNATCVELHRHVPHILHAPGLAHGLAIGLAGPRRGRPWRGCGRGLARRPLLGIDCSKSGGYSMGLIATSRCRSIGS